MAVSFVDTNIWLYALIEGQSAEKTRLARSTVSSDDVAISSQVINEMTVNLARKASFSEEQLRELIAEMYVRHVVVDVGRDQMLRASELRERYQFSF